jgi:two-component system cell cycle response regulator
MAKFAHVLVASDNPLERTRFDGMLAKADYGCIEADTVADIVPIARRRQPDAVLVEGTSEDHRLVAVVHELRRDSRTARIPLMLVVRSPSDELRRQCVELAVEDLIEGRHDDTEILARLRPLARLAHLRVELEHRIETAGEFGQDMATPEVRTPEDQPCRVLVVGPPSATVDAIATALRDDAAVAFETDPYRATRIVEGHGYDGMVLALEGGSDAERPFHLSSQVRRNPSLFNLPVLLVYGAGVIGEVAQAYRAGVSVALPMPVNAGQLRASLQMLLKRQRLCRNIRGALELTLTDDTRDPETGVYRRRFLQAHVERLVASARARDVYLNAAVISIRNLADVQGRYGKDAVKLLMAKLADWIRGLVRIEDLTARLGPAAFCIVLPGTSFEEAATVPQRVAAILHQSDFALGEEIMTPVRVQVAAGLVALQKGGDTVENLLRRAEKAAG